MEINPSTPSLRNINPREAKTCSLCSELLSSKTQTDSCGRCKARWEEDKRRSMAMETSPLPKYVPTTTEVSASGLAMKKGESSSSAQIQRVNQWLRSSPYPTTPAGSNKTCKLRVPVSNKSRANPYPEVHDRQLGIPSTSSRPLRQTPPDQATMVFSHLSTESVPLPAPTVPHFNAKGGLIYPITPPTIPPPNMTLPYEPIYHIPPPRECRQCAQPGCAATLLPNDGPDICSRCYTTLAQSRHNLFQAQFTPVPSHIPLSDDTAPGSVAGSSIVHSAIVPPLDTSEDVCYNSDDLELQYPEPEHEVSRTSQPLTTLTGYEEPSSILAVPFPVYGVPHHLPSFVEPSSIVIRHPLPVPRPTMSKLSPVQRQNSTSDLRPRPPKAKSGRRCITPDCNATLHIDSTTLRCFLCVKKEWQSKLQVHADARSARPPKKRKTVTWSDVLEVDLCARENASTEKKGTGNSTGRNTQTPTKLKIRIPAFRTLNPSSERSSSTQTSTVANSEASGCREIPSSSTSPSSQPTDDSSISTVSSSHLRETPPTSIASTSPIFSHSRINHIPESPLSRPREPDPSATAAIPDPATSSSKSENTLLQHISGWDSDLSDLTDPQESDVEQLLSDEEPTHKRPIIKIRIPARPASVLRSDGTLCSIPQCRRILPEGYRWKCCIQCRLHHREYQRKRLNIQGKHKRLDDEVDKVSQESESRHDSTAKPPPDLLTPGARLCMVKNCTQIIPSPEDYPWKMCESCRIQRQNIAIMRRMKNMGGNPTGLLGQRISEAGRTMLADECSESESESEGVPLVVPSAEKQGSRGLLRRCRRPDCGLQIDSQSQGTLCNRCKKRKSILKVSSPANVPKSTPETVKRLPAPKKTIPPYTEYICWSSLLDVFHKRVAGFLEAHRCYKRFKQTSQPAQAVKQASFKFEGEYSVVALDFKVLDRKPEVHRHTMRLKDDIGHAGDLLFLSTYWVTILEQEEGVATRFKCKLRSLQMAEMHGELEIAVFPDHSHALFPGQRTIVRFCLVV